jgi:membrane protease YdiL (CAAX protease family)
MRVGFAAYYHLAFFGAFIPYLAFKSGRRLGGRPLPPKVKYFSSQIIILTIFFVVSAFVARREWIDVFPREVPDARMFVLGTAVLVAFVVLMRPMWRKRVEERSRKAWLFMPRTRQERDLWAGCSLAAGVSEELTYRGVMFVVLWRVTGSALAAALVAAAVFSISHFLQGWKSMTIIFGMALAFQLIAWVSGSLYVGMAVHALYDVTAGFAYGAYGAYGEKLGYPIEPMPP